MMASGTVQLRAPMLALIIEAPAGMSRVKRAIEPLNLAIVLAISGVLGAPAALADRPSQTQQHRAGEQRPQQRPRDESGITLDEAVNRAEHKYRARVIRAETRESNGRRVHVLRLLSEDGRVWTVKIDAASGAEH